MNWSKETLQRVAAEEAAIMKFMDTLEMSDDPQTALVARNLRELVPGLIAIAKNEIGRGTDDQKLLGSLVQVAAFLVAQQFVRTLGSTPDRLAVASVVHLFKASLIAFANREVQ